MQFSWNNNSYWFNNINFYIKEYFILNLFRIKNNEAYIINMFIDKYDEGNIFNHEPTRQRKLLLHKKEIKRLLELTSREGYTLVPTSIYIKGDFAKVSIGVAKGKKLYDKREVIKKRDLERDNRLRR